MSNTRVLRSIRIRLTAKQNGKCHYCKCTMTECDGVTPTSVTLDHVIPLCAGGLNHPSNMVAACFACNQDKADAVPLETRAKPRPKRKHKAKAPPADLHIQASRAAAKMASRWSLGA